jgi:hypothetical protein
LASESGLFSAGMKMTLLAPLAGQPATIFSPDDITPDSAFTGGSIKSTTPLTLVLADGILAEPGPAGDGTSNGVRRVPLGTFFFTTAPTFGQSTLMQIGDYDDFGKSSDTLTWVGTELDKSIAPATFTISVVPEASTLLLLFGGLLVLRKR